MATTLNFGWAKPDVGGSQGTWGTVLNAALDAADVSLKAVSDVANAALPKAGAVMTGRLDQKTTTIARQDKGSISGVNAFDLAVAQYFTFTVGGALSVTFSNVPAGGFATGIIMRVVNGGAAVITWPASVKWPNGAAPALTIAGTDVLVLITDDNGATWRGMVAGKDIR